MAHPIAFAILVLVGIIATLVRDRLRPGLVMASGAVVFYCGGLLSTKELLEGFANKGLMTVALLFLISEGVRRSGLLEKFVGHILPKRHTSVKRTQLFSLPFVAFISAFLNNTPVVVIFAPMLKRWAEQKHLSATKFLIPLSYATILGGMCTLIGTSTNLVVDGLVTEAGFPGFSMFEIGKVGIFIAFFGLLYLILFSDRLLPEAREPINLADAGNFKGKDLQRIEVVLSARFPAIGRSVFDFDFKKKYGAFPIEISRGGKTILMRDMRKLNYREGDTVVLMADRNFMENWGDSSFFLMVSGEQETEPKMARWKRWTALGLLITMIIGATLGEMNKGEAGGSFRPDMFFFAAVVACLMAWLKIYPPRKYTKFISWDILITIAGAFAISKAMLNSGLAGAIAQFAIGLTDRFGPLVLLAVIFIITDLFTELMTNNAAAALIFPISLSIAEKMGVSPTPFFITICIAASTSFATPIGYQTNLIVQGLGGYRFVDFTRVGLPLNILALVITILLVPIFWPF